MDWYLVGVAQSYFLYFRSNIEICAGVFEKPLFGDRRPVTPYITVLVYGISFGCCPFQLRFGVSLRQPGAFVSNHTSCRYICLEFGHSFIRFKIRSSKWPGIGLLAKATGTLFIRRERKRLLLKKNYSSKE